ncbi:hypothetical protein DFH08DRAFT_507239 [Mycena albidolilacea]|uniref:Secreted protein n=1 Tax=Mycena albidolilacea TaxID=1033008 RepID=A0AAD7ADE9_9AGAR|nr:hypothetical protein DFH08DRAFT_507239 [Mycena albidolilacea]
MICLVLLPVISSAWRLQQANFLILGGRHVHPSAEVRRCILFGSSLHSKYQRIALATDLCMGYNFKGHKEWGVDHTCHLIQERPSFKVLLIVCASRLRSACLSQTIGPYISFLLGSFGPYERSQNKYYRPSTFLSLSQATLLYGFSSNSWQDSETVIFETCKVLFQINFWSVWDN